MAECFICTKNNGYGGYRDGGCEHLKDRDILSPEDGICKYIELYDDGILELIKNVDDAHSPDCIPYIKDIIEKRKNKHNNN